MKQPNIGIKLTDLRHIKGLTQKELSDQCGIDIRTIQRIEAGEVVPRMSTLKLIAELLEFDIGLFNGWNIPEVNKQQRQFLLFSTIMGLIYLVNWVFYMPFFPTIDPLSFPGRMLLVSIIHMVTGVSLYHGFYTIGKIYNNQILKFSSILIMIVLPLLVLSQLVLGSTSYQPATYLTKLFVLILGMNGFVFGFGLIKCHERYSVGYTLAGILQVLISPMFIIPIPLIQMIGLWSTIPFTIFLIFLLFSEYKN